MTRIGTGTELCFGRAGWFAQGNQMRSSTCEAPGAEGDVNRLEPEAAALLLPLSLLIWRLKINLTVGPTLPLPPLFTPFLPALAARILLRSSRTEDGGSTEQRRTDEPQERRWQADTGARRLSGGARDPPARAPGPPRASRAAPGLGTALRAKAGCTYPSGEPGLRASWLTWRPLLSSGLRRAGRLFLLLPLLLFLLPLLSF